MASFPPYVIFVEGQLVAKATSISKEHPDNDTDVTTITGGHEGPAPGPQQTLVTVEEVVPDGGVLYDWEKRWQERVNIDVEIRQITSDKKMAGTFRIASVSDTSTVGAPVQKTITMKSIGVKAPIFE